MKSLVVYYSFEGSTELLAKTLAKALKADLLKLEPINEIRSKGFMKYVWGGKQVMFKSQPELKPFNTDFKKYNLIIFGSPVWAFTFAPPLRSFFSNVKLSGKRVGLFCCCDGNAGKTLEYMGKELAGNEVVGQVCFTNVKNNSDACVANAKKWALGLIQ